MNTYERCLLYCLVAALFSMVLLTNASAIGCNTSINYPTNVTNWWNNTYNFGFLTNCTSTPISCALYINGSNYGTASVVNNTATYITANATIPQGNHSWYITCTEGIFANSTGTYMFYVKVVCDGALDATTGRPSGHYCNDTSIYTTAGAGLVMGYYNTTDVLIGDGTGTGWYNYATGAHGGGCAGSSGSLGFACVSGTTDCYFLTASNLKKWDVSTCGITTYAPGGTFLGGLARNAAFDQFGVTATVAGFLNLSVMSFNGVTTSIAQTPYYPAPGVTTTNLDGVFASLAGDYVIEADRALGNATDGCKKVYIEEYPSMENTSAFYVCNGAQGFLRGFFVHNGVFYGLSGGATIVPFNLTVTAPAPPAPPVVANCSAGMVCGVITDCANASGLEGVTVLVTQHNASSDFTFTNTTNASGYFELAGVQQGLTAQIVYTLDPYASGENEFLLTPDSDSWDASTCLATFGTPKVITTSFELSSNETAEHDYAVTHSDWQPTVNYKKDTLIMGVQFVVTSAGEPVTGLDLNASVVDTSCSYAITPSNYSFFEMGEGRYAVLADIGGTLTPTLYAFCQDGEYFDINYLGSGLNARGRIDFQAYQMRATNVQLMVDDATPFNATFCNYTWALGLADLYQDTGDNRNLGMNNFTCTARLEFYGQNITQWENAVITNWHAAANFTTISLTPMAMQIHWNCTSPGFDYFDETFTVRVGEDAFTLAYCWVADPNGYRLDWNKIGQQVNHWCAFRTYYNASLLNMRVKSDNSNANKERVFAYTYDQYNNWYYSTGLFYDDMPKGLNQWDVTLTSYPVDIYPAALNYFQFVKVYITPPSKISPDYCDGVNCQKMIYKGDNYFCKVQTTFESDYTNIVSGIKLNGSATLYSIAATDKIIDTVKHTHETSFEIPAMGESDKYGISSDTNIQCFFELYIDNEKLTYGASANQMTTKYSANYPSDILGMQRGWNTFANQKDKMSWVFNQIGNIPAWFMASIHITDASGNINPILLVVYLIAFALIAALAIVFMSTRNNQNQGGGYGGDFRGYQFRKR